MTQGDLHDHHHVRAFVERALVLRRGLAVLDAARDGAAALRGEDRLLARVVEEQLLPPALVGLVAARVVDLR